MSLSRSAAYYASFLPGPTIFVGSTGGIILMISIGYSFEPLVPRPSWSVPFRVDPAISRNRMCFTFLRMRGCGTRYRDFIRLGENVHVGKRKYVATSQAVCRGLCADLSLYVIHIRENINITYISECFSGS